MAPKTKANFDEQLSTCHKVIDKLSSMNAPVVIAINYGGKIQTFGAQHARDYLASSDDFKNALNQDALDLCSRDAGGREPVRNVKNQSKENQAKVVLAAPIELLNRKKTIEALRDLIVYDHNKSTGEKKNARYIKYGEESWEPSFWPNDIWKWSDITNFSDIRVKMLRDAGLSDRYQTLSAFFKDVLKMGFDHLKLNENDHVSDKFTKEQERRLKKVRHIKSPPVVTTHASNSNEAVADSPRSTSSVAASENPVFSDGLPNSEEEFVGEQYEYHPPSDTGRIDENPVPAGTGIEPETSIESSFSSDENVSEVDVPYSAKGRVWPNCKVQRNMRGASSIMRSAAQSVGLPEEYHFRIRLYIHEKIIEALPELKNFYKFPVQLYSEDDSVTLTNEAELVTFLRTQKSLAFYNIPMVEILALAGLTGGKVHVLYKSAVGPGGFLNLDQRWEWATHLPIAPQNINVKGRLYTGSDMCLVTEDNVHFYYLSGFNSTLPTSTSVKTPTNIAQNDAAADEAIIAEANEEVDVDRYAMVPISKLRRSTRTSKKTERFKSYNQQRNRSTKAKEGSKNQKAEQCEMTPASSIDSTESVDLEDIDEELLDKQALQFMKGAKEIKQTLLIREQKENALREKGRELQNALSPDNIRGIIQDNLEYLKGIENGKIKSWRRDFYYSGKEQQLLFKTISEPFTDEQQNVVFDELRKHFLKKNQLMSRFLDYVLMSEAFIRIYQIFFDVTRKEAETNLNQQGIYRSNSEESNGFLI